MSRTEIHLADWAQDKHWLQDIRTRVFVQEQHVSQAEEWDGLDESALHFLVWVDNKPVGCARLLLEDSPVPARFHIGRVAILAEYRGRGLGQQLMQAVLAYCQPLKPWPIYLGAQSDKTGFYAQLGFQIRGEEFMDAGIPHRHMWLEQAALQE